MLSRLAVGFALICAIHGAPQPKADERMTLDVYYESLCPDSRNFLVTQLNPNWPTLSTFTDLRLVPFGKATFVSNPEGGWDFECQHGAAECRGNILHACGIKYSPSVTQALNFTTCLMDAPISGKSCAESAGLDYTPIDACQNDVEGQNLVHDYGVETLNLDPTLTFVPWLIYNKVWNESNQWESLTNVTGVACNNAPANTPACLV
ncbi:GILT-like protein 1 [Daphnia magna]|uniref:GILT-like protein 1 n=1 Tax=Daphnia magna TaxID=35525 RepID=UPI001E1BA936|nr:GILT-like protein 1 [Daphnia magna]